MKKKLTCVYDQNKTKNFYLYSFIFLVKLNFRVIIKQSLQAATQPRP